jgi:hypothetical protein
VSQSPLEGTVTLTSDNVISDNSGLGRDMMQRLTYKLSHLYFNWSVTTGELSHFAVFVWLKEPQQECVAYHYVSVVSTRHFPLSRCFHCTNIFCRFCYQIHGLLFKEFQSNFCIYFRPCFSAAWISLFFRNFHSHFPYFVALVFVTPVLHGRCLQTMSTSASCFV